LRVAITDGRSRLPFALAAFQIAIFEIAAARGRCPRRPPKGRARRLAKAVLGARHSRCEDLDAHVDYIYWNPVKHRLVAAPDDWPYSTYHEWKKEFGRPINVPPQDWSPLHLGER